MVFGASAYNVASTFCAAGKPILPASATAGSSAKQPHADSAEEEGGSTNAHARSSLRSPIRGSVTFGDAADTEAPSPGSESPKSSLRVDKLASMERAARGSLQAHSLEAAAKLAERASSGSQRKSSRERSSVEHSANKASPATSTHNTSTSSQSNELVRRSAYAIKTWTMKRKDALIPDAMKMYALPGSSSEPPAVHRRVKDSIDLQDVGLSPALHGHKKRISFALNGYRYKFSGDIGDDFDLEAAGPGADRTKLSIYQATEELANANVSIAAVKDLIHRFQVHGIDPMKEFTKEYLIAQHMYGTMTDYLRDLWITTTNLGKEVELDIDHLQIPGMDRLAAYAYARGEAIEHCEKEMQREKLARWLKMVLNSLNELNWEHMKLDFAKWVRSTQDNDLVLRDALEHIGEHMDEVLNLLTVSRFAIEESLGSHLVIGADALTQFYEEMQYWSEEVAQKRDAKLGKRGKRRNQRRHNTNEAMQNMRLQQLLAIAKDEKERQRRNLEINEELHAKMLQAVGRATPGTPASESSPKSSPVTSPRSDGQSQPSTPGKKGRPEQSMNTSIEMQKILAVSKAVDKLKKKGDQKTIIIGGPGGGGAQHVMKPQIEMTQNRPKPYAHLEAMFTRAIAKAREALEAVTEHTKDREEQLEQVQLAHRYAVKVAKQKLRRARTSYLSTHGWIMPGVDMSKESEQLQDVQTQCLMIPKEGIEDTEPKWEDEDIQELVARRKELSERLNNTSLPISLAGVWGKRRFHAQQQRLGSKAPPKRGFTGGLQRRPSQLTVDAPSAGARRPSFSRRPSQLLGAPASPGSRRPSMTRLTGSPPQALSDTPEQRRDSGVLGLRRDSGLFSAPDQSSPPGSPSNRKGKFKRASTVAFAVASTRSDSSDSTRRSSGSRLRGAARNERASADDDDLFGGGHQEEDGHCLNSLLKILTELEHKDLNRERKFAQLDKANKKLFARMQRRYGEDLFVYDDQEFQLWFKKNSLWPLVDKLQREVGAALSSGTLLLGRKGEQNLKDFQSEVKALVHTLQLEDEERERCVEAKISFDEAAWHFRTHFPMIELQKRFGPVWAGLKDRISFGSSLMNAQKADGIDADGADKIYQDHMSLQSQLKQTERDAHIRHDLVAMVKREADRLQAKRDHMKIFCDKFMQFQEARERVGGMRLNYREMQRKLVDIMQELRFITLGIARSKDKEKSKATDLDVELDDPFGDLGLDAPWEKGKEPQQSASAQRAQELLRKLHEKLFSPQHVASFATPLFHGKGRKRRKKKGQMTFQRGSHEAVFQLNADKIREMMEHLEKAGGILKLRVDRKREDLRRMVDKMTQGNRACVPLTKEEMQEKWGNETIEMNKKIKNLTKMIHFWEERLGHWYEEVRVLYGGDVTEALQDTKRHDCKDGNTFLLNAITSHYAKEFHAHAVPQMSLNNAHKVHSNRQMVKSLVFEKAMQSLTEIDSIRQATTDWRRGASFISAAQGRLTDIPSEMQEHIHRLQMSLEKDDPVMKGGREAALPSLPSVFGGGRIKKQSGHLYRSTLGKSLKRRGTTIRDRVMQIFMKANAGGSGFMDISGEDTVERFNERSSRSSRHGRSGSRTPGSSVLRGHGSSVFGMSRLLHRGTATGNYNRQRSTRRTQGSRTTGPRTMFDSFLSVSGRGSVIRVDEDDEEEDESRRSSRKRSTNRQSVSFRTDEEMEAGIYEDSDSDASSTDFVERVRERGGAKKKKQRQSNSSSVSGASWQKRPSSAGSNKSDSRISVSSSTYSKRSRREQDGMDMDENIERLKDRAERLERRRRKREEKSRDTDPGTARVHMLRLFMDDAEAGEDDKSKVKSTRFKQRASVISETKEKAPRRETRKFLQELRGRHRSTQGSGGTRRSNKRLEMAEENRRNTFANDKSDMVISSTKAAKHPSTKSEQDVYCLDKPDLGSDEEIETKTEKIPRRTLKADIAFKVEGNDESSGTSDSGSESSDSRKMEDLDEVLEKLEEERNSPTELAKQDEIYSSMTSVPQLGLRLLRNCRDRMLQEFNSFEKAYDRAAAHGVMKVKGRHRSSTYHNPGRRQSVKQDPLTAYGFIWLAAKLGYGEDDARAIFDHLTFAAGAETVSDDIIMEGDEENGLSVTRHGFVEALRTALPLNNMMQLRLRLQQRYGRLDILFDLTNNGSEWMTLATFCTLCESVGAIVKEATPLFQQMELHNEIPADYVSGSQVSKRAFILSMRHAEALAAARRLTKRLRTMYHMRGMEALEGSEADDLAAAGIGGPGIVAKKSGRVRRGSYAMHSNSSPEGSEPSGDEGSYSGGPSIHSTEKAAALYQLFMSSVDKKYHDKPISMDAMRTAVKTMVPFKEDVRLLFRLVQKSSQSGGPRARIQDLALRALGGLGYTCKVIAEAVGYNMGARHGGRTGQRFNAASSRGQSARLAARQAQAPDGLFGLDLVAGHVSSTEDESGAFADESGAGESSSGEMLFGDRNQDRIHWLPDAHSRVMVPRKGLAERAQESAQFTVADLLIRKRVQKRPRERPAPPQRKKVRPAPQQRHTGHRGAKSKVDVDKPLGGEAAGNDGNEEEDHDDEEDDVEKQEVSEEARRPTLQLKENFRSMAMRKKSVINTDSLRSSIQSNHEELGQCGTLEELGSRRGTVVDLGSARSSSTSTAEHGEDAPLSPQAMRKKSIMGSRRPTMPSLDEESQDLVAKKIDEVVARRRTLAGTEEAEGSPDASRSSTSATSPALPTSSTKGLQARRETRDSSGIVTFDRFFGRQDSFPSSSEGEEKSKRAARPGAIRRQITGQLKSRDSGTRRQSTVKPLSPTSLEKRRIKHGMTADASTLHIFAHEDQEDDNLWKWKDDPTEKSPTRFKSMGDILSKDGRSSALSKDGRSSATPELPEVRPESVLTEGSQAEEGGSSSASGTDHAEGSVASDALQEVVRMTNKRQAIEKMEADRHRKRLDLFNGDQMELQIATQRLQDCRVRFLLRFRSPGKAFEVLAGSRDAKLAMSSLQTKVEKVVSFNPLDAERVVTVIRAVIEAPELCYNDFLNVMRFATPVHSILEFRSRLVQRYCQAECALRVFGFADSAELDVGLFDRPMVGAGVVTNDALRLFRVADTAQPGGPRGYLSVDGLRFALDHAHVLAWLEAFYVRVAAAKGRISQSVHDAIAGAGKQDASEGDKGHTGPQITEDEPIATAGMLSAVLANLEFPVEFAADTFAFLQRRSPQVTLAGLAHVIQHAFGTETKRQHKSPTSQEKATSSKLGLFRAAAKAKAQRGLGGDFGLVAKTAHTLSSAVGGLSGLSASGSGAGAAAGAATTSAPTPGESHAAMRVTEEVREEALVQTRHLRRYVITHFANYQEAYLIFNRKSPLDGVALDEWMEAMEAFRFSEPAGWEQIFGHIIDWRHLRWDPRYRGTEGRVTLAGMANALDHAAPCTTPVALRKLLQEKYGTMQKAWVQLSGRDGVEDVTISVWQQAMHKIAVVAEDAGHLHAVLRAAPITERVPDNHNLQLSRVAFLSAMRSAEAVKGLLDLLLRISNQGSTSQAFEARVYPLEPLSAAEFEEQLADMMQPTEARLLFSYCDVNQEGLVSICDLLDALTVMQATYFPFAPPPGSRTAAEQQREFVAVTGGDTSTPLPTSPSRENASETPTSALISPSDVKGRSASEMRVLCSPYDDHLQNVSTTVPESIFSDNSEEGSDVGLPERRQRPWTSMEVGSGMHASETSALPPARGGGSALGFAPGLSSVRAGSIANRGSISHGQAAFTHAPFLPQLDLAAAQRASVMRRSSLGNDGPPRGWEQVNTTSGSSPAGDLLSFAEDQMETPGPRSEAAGPSERVLMAPRPHSELAASRIQDSPSPTGPAESAASMPRPHSELGPSSDRDRPLARTAPPYVGRSSMAGRAQTPNPLEAASASAAAARHARPSSELGMARQGRRSTQGTPRAASSQGEAPQQSRSPPLPALSGHPKAKPGSRTGRKSSSGGIGNMSARRS